MADLLYLGNQLSRHGLNPTSVETLGERLSKDFHLVRGSDKKNPFIRLLHMWSLVLENRNARYLLIDTYSSQAFWYAVTTAWLAQLVGLPYVPILHGGDLPKRIVQSPGILRHFLKNAAHVVCPSGYLQTEMAGFFRRDYTLIPNFIDLKYYPLHSKSAKQGVRLLWVRSFHQIYNPSLSIDVLNILLQKGLDARLAMVGPDKDGSLELTREYARKKGVLHKVQFPGGLGKMEWISFSRLSSRFLLA